MIKYVVWDWNGTLLDDVDGCVRVLNQLLERRALAPLTREHYRARFGFPIRPFYEALGFDVSQQAFAALADEFIAAYRSILHEVSLHNRALEVVASLAPLVRGQVVVSAMEHSLLGTMLADYGVLAHLQAHHGTENVQAGSKVQIGLAAVAALGARPEDILLVGDTAHDHELAQAIGCQCVLLSLGHQDVSRLERTGRPVLLSLDEVVALVQAADAAR